MSLSLAAIAAKSNTLLSGIPYAKRAARIHAARLADIRAQHPGKLWVRHCQRQVTLERRDNGNGDDFAYFHIPK
jgi:hypothetical protein